MNSQEGKMTTMMGSRDNDDEEAEGWRLVPNMAESSCESPRERKRRSTTSLILVLVLTKISTPPPTTPHIKLTQTKNQSQIKPKTPQLITITKKSRPHE